MVSPRIVRAAIALLLAGCHGGALPAPAPAPDAATKPDSAPAPDAAAPDAAVPEKFGAATTWGSCGMLGKLASVISLAASPDGRFLAAGGFESSIWDLRSETLLRSILTDGGLHYGFSRDGELLALTGDARSVYRVADGQMIFGVSERGPDCIDWSSAGTISPDNRRLAMGSCGHAELHELSGQGVTRLPSHVFQPGVAYSPDGRLLATSGPELYTADGRTRLWPAQVVPGPGPAYPAFAPESLRDNLAVFSPDGSLLLVSNTIDRPTSLAAAWEASTQLVRVADGSVVRDFGTSLPRHPSFSPDGAWILAGARLIHLRTLTSATLAEDMEIAIFLPDGRIAAAGKDAVVRLFCPR